MIFKSGDKFSGFVCERSEYIKGIDSDLYLMKHESSGATLVAIKNSDTNKTFSIAFRTLPENSTGVAHIIEHSVLSGSKKYPLSDVFGELIKGSTLTFVNALTGPDRTMYPFSTRNSKEYFNTMDIYLDTVLNPLLKRETFLKEGWHYKVNEDGSLDFSGIVYNEMKGAFSDPFRLLNFEVKRNIYAETSYQYDSGGDPDVVPELSYEQFIEFYKKSYHPNNSTIYLYGDEDLKKELRYLNENFLKNYSLSDTKIEFAKPKEMDGLVKSYQKYPLNQDDPKDKTFASLSMRFDEKIDSVTSTALSLITSLLFRSDSSKLKREVLDNKIAGDFNGYFSDNFYYPMMMMYLINSNREEAEKFVDIYSKSVDYYIENGFDKEILESELNGTYFNIMEDSIDSNRGYVYMQQAVYSTNFGDDIFKSLNIGEIYKGVKDFLNSENGIKDLLTKYFKPLNKGVFVIMEPDSALNERKAKAIQEKLKKVREGLSEEEFKSIKEDYLKLQNIEQENNGHLIPKLDKKDLDPIDHSTKLNKIDINGINLFYTEEFCNSISFLDVGFRLDSVPKRLLPLVDIFSILVGDLGTKNRDYKTLTRDINSYLGGFSHSFQIHSEMGNRSQFKPVLWFNSRFINDFYNNASDLLIDIFENLSFEDGSRLKELLNKSIVYKERYINSEGLSHLIYQTKYGTSLQGEYSEYVNGLTSFQYIKKIFDNYEDQKEKFVKDLVELKQLIFSKDNLIFSSVTDRGNIGKVKDLAEKIIGVVDEKSSKETVIEFEKRENNKAVITNAQIVFNGIGVNLYDYGMEYKGSFDVLRQWISREYLFENIRLKGGAYGAFCRFNEIDGFFGLYTYRDPNLTNSYEAFNNLGDTLKDLDISEEAIDRFIIGAYSEYNPLLNPYSRMVSLRDRSIANISDQFIDTKVREILSTTLNDMKSYAALLSKGIESSNMVSLGNGDIVEGSDTKFETTVKI